MKRASLKSEPVVDVQSQFKQLLIDEYQNIWGGEILGPHPHWLELLVLHFQLQELVHQATQRGLTIQYAYMESPHSKGGRS